MLETQLCEIYDDAWWMRAFDGELNPAEQVLWETHLEHCDACRDEWEALLAVDEVLAVAPAAPPLPEHFAARTLERVTQQQELRLWRQIVGGIVIVAMMLTVAFFCLGSLVDTIQRWFAVLYPNWNLLAMAAMRTVLGLMSTFETLLPFLLLAAALWVLMLMPNGLLATVALMWMVSRRREDASGA